MSRSRSRGNRGEELRHRVVDLSAALRAANLGIMGSGQGSVGTEAIVAGLPELAAVIAAGALTTDAAAVPLDQVETAWTAPANGRRIVFTP